MDNFRFEKSVPAVETDGLTSGVDEEIRYLDRIESKDPRTAQSKLVFPGLRVKKSVDCSWTGRLWYVNPRKVKEHEEDFQPNLHQLSRVLT